jgi:hypothetical protein
MNFGIIDDIHSNISHSEKLFAQKQSLLHGICCPLGKGKEINGKAGY